VAPSQSRHYYYHYCGNLLAGSLDLSTFSPGDCLPLLWLSARSLARKARVRLSPRAADERQGSRNACGQQVLSRSPQFAFQLHCNNAKQSAKSNVCSFIMSAMSYGHELGIYTLFRETILRLSRIYRRSITRGTRTAMRFMVMTAIPLPADYGEAAVCVLRAETDRVLGQDERTRRKLCIPPGDRSFAVRWHRRRYDLSRIGPRSAAAASATSANASSNCAERLEGCARLGPGTQQTGPLFRKVFRRRTVSPHNLSKRSEAVRKVRTNGGNSERNGRSKFSGRWVFEWTPRYWTMMDAAQKEKTLI
jgi:hypothetical protein